LGTALGGLDFETAGKLTGSRFVLLKGWAAQMERALISFMLDVQTLENGYAEVMPPVIVNRESLLGTGQLPNSRKTSSNSKARTITSSPRPRSR
jgi:seryl-tRNA synthetase